MRTFLPAALALALPFQAAAAQAPPATDFIDLFATTCVAHFHAQDRLREAMSARGASVIKEQPASFFLGGQPGTAWSLRTAAGRHVVALREDGVCAVSAQRADLEQVHAGFAALAATAPAPMVARPRDDAGPSGGALRTVAYAWRRPGERAALLFTLTTSSETSATIQAMASLALVDEPAGNP